MRNCEIKPMLETKALLAETTMHLDLTDLRLFAMVVDAGSITAGGANAGLALASASARIRGMEEQVGVPLLERERRGVHPTPAGRALLHHARLLMRQVEQMRGELGEYSRGLKGHVRLLANTTAASEFLPQLLASFLSSHPNVDIDLDERPSTTVAHDVGEGLADLGVAADHADFSGLESFPFGPDRLVLALPPDHPWAEREQMPFAEALAADFIGLAGDSALHQHLVGHAARAGGRMRVRARAYGVDVVCRMVALGAGVAVVGETAARRWSEPLRLGWVPLADSWAERRLYVVARRVDALPPQAQQLAAHLIGAADLQGG
jgi:DNA-binding transcriptional LysR family regulator